MGADRYPEIIDDLPVADQRLRPQSPLLRVTDKVPPEYAITSASHPELVEVLRSLLKRAEIGENYQMVLLGGGFGGAGVDFDRKLIGIGEKKFLNQSLEEMRYTIGHEVAHIWRKQHPGIEGPVASGYRGLTGRQQEEIEADLLGACLAQNKEGALGVFTNPNTRASARADAPSLEVRAEAIRDFDLSRCTEWLEWDSAAPVAPSVPGKNRPSPDKTR